MYYRIKAIVFDLGRVLAAFDHRRIWERLAEFSNLDPLEIHRIIFKEGLEKEYDSGRMSSFDFFIAVCKKINASVKLDYDNFTEIWGNIFTPNTDIEDVIASICPEIRKILLSNTNELHWQYIEKIPVIQEFFSDPEFLVRSYTEGMCKPEPEIFQLAIQKAGCLPEEIVYIDDIQEYIDVFCSLGGHGILYDCTDRTKDSTIDLLKKLSSFGVLV
jgi:FMN phosphatase YigB (HAD superfamily)